MPWKNGLGETLEVARSPDGHSLDAFDWRVSVAPVIAGGAFSVFPGIERTIAVIEGRAARRLGRVRKDLEDMDVARQITEFSEEILVPATAVMKRVKRRASIMFYAMVGGDGVINGIVLRGVGVDGGLITTWAIAFLMAGIIVGLGKALGGLLLPKLRRRDLPLAGMSLVLLAAGLLVLLALYLAVALGIARASGSFDIFAIIKILKAPTDHIGALGLTIVSGFFFIVSTRLSYRFKRDFNERYERIVEMLADRELSAGAIADRFDMSPPAISQHLSVLRRARLVKHEAEGTKRHYRADPHGLDRLRVYLESMWDDVLTTYAANDPAPPRKKGSR